MSKNALVTGGSRGIGLGITRKLLAAGYHVLINGVRDQNTLTELIDQLNQKGTVSYCQADIGTQEGRERLTKEVVTQFDELHLLVNNAGVAPKERKDILEVDENGYDYVMDINLKGTFFLTQALAKRMIQSKASNAHYQGAIVNISSISAEVASINRGEYCLSKAGMSMLTKLMAVRLAEADIPVFEVQPGIIETDMTAKVTEKYQQLIAEGLTLEKRLGQPEDIGTIVVALAERKIPYSTGQVINADGGMGVRRL